MVSMSQAHAAELEATPVTDKPCVATSAGVCVRAAVRMLNEGRAGVEWSRRGERKQRV